jgi:hypothetical protein
MAQALLPLQPLLNDIVEIITFTALSVVTDIPQSIVDAKGDLIVGTAADTVGRLAVGTDGFYLSADSSAGTGLAWAALTVPPADDDQPILAALIFG